MIAGIPITTRTLVYRPFEWHRNANLDGTEPHLYRDVGTEYEYMVHKAVSCRFADLQFDTGLGTLPRSQHGTSVRFNFMNTTMANISMPSTNGASYQEFINCPYDHDCILDIAPTGSGLSMPAIPALLYWR